MHGNIYYYEVTKKRQVLKITTDYKLYKLYNKKNAKMRSLFNSDIFPR